MSTNHPVNVTRPFPALGIGWLLAIILLILGILIAVGAIHISEGLVGGMFILTSLAILL